jgi:ribose transport system substrate-binding protein
MLRKHPRAAALLASAAALAVALAGAGISSASSSKSQASAQGRQEYLWVAANVAHPFYVEGKAGWEAAAKKLGVSAKLVGPQTADVQQQITIIEQALTKPTTAGLLIYPVDYKAMSPVLRKARQKGIPVVIGNGDAEDKSLRDAFVGTDNKALGATAADLVAQALKGKGKVGIVSFITALNHQQRVQGFKARLKEKYPGIKVLGIAPEDGTPEKAAAAAGAFLQAHRDVNLLWATDASSGAVARAIRQAGMADKVLSVGTDRTPEQLNAIREGLVYATIAQDTFAEEYLSLHYLYWIRNKILTPPDTTITRPLVITKKNVPKGK